MKNQIKKSFSLFLAVLMMLSCWVWIAPENLEADAALSSYTVTIGFDTVDNMNNSSAYFYTRVWYVPNNGTGTPTTGSTYKEGSSTGCRNTGTTTFDITGIPGWPYYIECWTNQPSGTNGDDGNPVWNYVSINGGPDIFDNQYTLGGTGNSGDAGLLCSGYTAPESASKGQHSGSWEKPRIAGFESSSGTAINVTLPASGSITSSATTFTYSSYYDQYGVTWTGTGAGVSGLTAGTPYISKTPTGDEITGDVAEDIKYAGSNKITVNSNLQVSAPSPTDGKYEGYLVQKFTSTNQSGGTETSTVSSKITVTYPKHTISVDGAGSITGLNYTLDMTEGNPVSTTWKKEGYYGATIGTMPSGTGSATGYTFKGLWTTKQPTTGNASYNAYEADFATPISSTMFDEYKTDGGTVDGNYITYNDVLYYNAGTEWSTSGKTITGGAEYYAWWVSTDINVKFYDIDGAFLGAKAVKYGQTQSALTWPTPTESYVSGAFEYKNFNGTWVDINGDTVSQSAHTFTRDLILTPKYDTVSFDNKYTVNFINENNGSNISGADYAYRTDLSAAGAIPADRTVPSTIRNDLQYSYTFEGWSTQKPSSGNYHILLEDGDFNEAGTAVHINSDWVVRSDMTFYPVYRRHLRTYAVNFYFKDSTGTEISRRVTLKYGETLVPPTDYVPYTYAQEGYGYEFANWAYTKGGAETTFGYNNTLVFTKENIDIGLGAVDDGVDVTPINIRAAYGDPVPTPYTVTFNYKNDKGEDLTHTAEVNHGTLILADDVDKLITADKYDDGEALVHFTGNWKVTEGAADKEEYATSELTSFSPTSHVTFEAVYGNPQPFYTVTYIDGGNIFSERVLVGSNLPVWTTKVTNDNETPDNAEDDFEEDVEYKPTMADTAQGSYAFQGWFDEKQTDTTYAATNGNKYDATSKVTGNVTLYPQFKFSPFTYTIKFMDYEGKVQLAAGEFEYGQNIEAVTAVAVKAAQGRAQDDTYTYSFIGWDQPVPTFCEGQDMTFIALYKPVYRYYVAKWYNSVLVDGKWTADKSTKTEDDETVETALLATSKHTYNSKVYNPSVAATCTVTPQAGQSYVFNGWYYNDADGNAQPYVRGMLITADMEFYATYRLTAKLYTVTTDVKGTKTEYQVADGATAAAVPTPNAGYVDATKHDEFAGWVTKDADGNETPFNIATATITADITIYAKFTESEHDYEGNEELVKSPTYYEKGEKKVWCSCDAKLTEKTEEIAELTDTVKPTGTIYLGTQGSWSSTDETGAAATDGDEVTLYANANTDIIITVNDTGDVNALYNPSGIGKGVKLIRSFVSSDTFTQEQQGNAASMAITVFEAPYELDENNNKVYSQDLNNTANYVFKLGDYETIGGVKLEEGKTYIAYYYVADKANNYQNLKVRTAKFIYDNTAPVFTVVGDNNADKLASGTPTYCGKATVTGVEVGATLTVNGVEVALTTTSAAGTGTYTISEAGNYLVTVTDKAGNSTSKKFTVNADHSYDVTEVPSTCTEDGYKTEKCIVCDHEKDKVDYEAPGHVTTPAMFEATCTENGYVLITCANCDYSEKVEFEVDADGEFVLDDNGEKIALYPALGHNYDKVDGEIVYTVVTAATCRTKGKETATCKDCGETLTREIAIDEDAHNWGAVKTLKATCTEAGKTYKTCKLCYTSEDVSVLPATGHVETQWVVTTPATCGTAGVETKQCTKCKTLIGAYVTLDFSGNFDETKYEKILDENGDPISYTDAYGQVWFKCYELDENGDRIFKYETQSIPATGRHILAVSEDPTKTFEATADKEGQITRYCTQCGQEWVEKVAKIEKYTVKFVDEDGTTEIKTIADVVKGTTITKDAVTEPTKDNSEDGKYAYKFAGWKDANGNSVALPIDVTADITLKASYTEATIIYTHEFLVPNTWVSPLEATDGYVEYATMMGAMGDSRVPVAEPKFSLADKEADAKLKKLYTFKFLGWSTTGAEGDIVTDFTITGDTTFYAVFEAIAVQYQVIYYNGTEYVWDTTVDGGDTVTFGGTTPTKAADATNHYTFDKWYTDATLKTAFDADTAITATTRLYAGFTATAHSWAKDAESDENKAATCTEAAKVAYKCSACGETKVETEGTANGHTPAAAVKEQAADGTWYSVVYCSVETCKAEISRTKTSVTVTFKYDSGVVLDVQTLDAGASIEYKGKTEPTKATDAQYTYSFAGWYVEGDADKTVVDLATVTATADVVYVAKFTATVRTFRVTYVDVNNNTIQTQAGIAYGAAVPEFTGTVPTKDKDDTNHYTFKQWSVAAGSTVTEDTVIQPVFNAIKHTYDDGVETGGSCTEPSGTKYTCTACGHSYNDGGNVATGHKFELINTVLPDYIQGIDGYKEYKCKNCPETYKETISSALVELPVNVKQNGSPVEGAKVVLYQNSAPTNYAGYTDANGSIVFYVVPGEYTVNVTYNGNSASYNVGVDMDGTVTGNKDSVSIDAPVVDTSCKCSCHKNNIWGTIFRFFQKIIKLFTGKVACCSEPDSRI